MAPSGAGAVFTALLITSAIGQEIAESPSDVTSFVNHVVLFTCMTHSAPIYQYWRVNGTAFAQLPSDIRDDLDTGQVTNEGNEEFYLIIPGRAEYNGTTLQCVAGGGGVERESENATLNIQGLLSSVGDLGTDSNASSITISWTAPFSLDVTDGDPKIYYSVLIYNETDETAVSVPYPNCINISETFCVFTPDHLSPCHMYIFTVIPYNGAGQGESSRNVSDISHGSPLIKVTGLEIRAINNGSECIVTFRVSGEFGSVCKYTLSVVEVTNKTTFIPRITAFENDATISYTLPANGRYSTAFEVETAAGATDIMNFTTFDIQNSEARRNGSRITVTGEFITDSLAKGCFIVLQCNESTADQYRAIPRNGSAENVTETIDVPSSTYTMYAYDIEGNDGLPYIMPANIPDGGQITVTTNNEPTPSSTILNRANISVTESQVTIDCEYTYECPLASCVLIYREYNTSTLTVIDYNPTTTVFPVTVTVDQPENFTFAIFGRNCNGELEEKPAMSLKLTATVTTPPDDSPQAESDADVAAVVGGTVPVALLVMVVGLTVIVVLVMVKKRGRIVKQCDVEGSPNCRPDCGRENVMLHDEEEEEIKSDSGTLSGSTMMMATEKKEDSKYPPVTIAPLKNQPQPSLDQAVQYQGIDFKKTKRAAHPHGLLYSDIVPPPPYSQGRNRIIEVDSTPTPYATILPHATSSDNPLSGPPTVEAVMGLLWSVAGLWRVIAERLGFDDDLIDEIYTNNETEEACLQDCVEQWMRLGPTWQKLAHVLSDMGQNSLAQHAWSGGFSTGSEESGGNGSSEFVGDGFGQAKNTSKVDESRGTHVCIPVSEEQHGSDLQANTILQEEGATDDITDMTTSCVSEEENANTESDSSTSEECTSDDDDTVSLALFGGTDHHISSLHVRTGSGCFETPPLPRQGDCKNATMNMEEKDDVDDPIIESFLTVCRQRMKSDVNDVFAVLQLLAKLPEDSEVSDRKIHSDAGPAAVLSVPCTDFPAADGGALHRAGKSEAIFNHSPGDEELTQTRSMQSTETSAHRRQLITASLLLQYTDLDEGTCSIVTGGMYTKPYLSERVMYCDSTSSTAAEIPPEDVMVEDAHLQQPLPTTLPSQQQQPKKKPPQVPSGNHQQIAKVDPPFKKRQWNDPPDNYQEEMERWTHTGVALGFHGPGNELAPGRNSHYG